MNIKNTSTLKELRDVTNASPTDNLPINVGSSVLPVVDINPMHNKVSKILFGARGSTTTSGNQYTAPANKRTYITGISFSIKSDVACDNTSSSLYMDYVEDATKLICSIERVPALASENHINVEFSSPLIMLEGDAISQTTTFTAGTLAFGLSIRGFQEDIV